MWHQKANETIWTHSSRSGSTCNIPTKGLVSSGKLRHTARAARPNERLNVLQMSRLNLIDEGVVR